jgi:hypothetical protein
MARRIRKPKSGKLIRKVSSQKKKRTVSKKRAVSAHKRLPLASSSDIFFLAYTESRFSSSLERAVVASVL